MDSAGAVICSEADRASSLAFCRDTITRISDKGLLQRAHIETLFSERVSSFFYNFISKIILDGMYVLVPSSYYLPSSRFSSALIVKVVLKLTTLPRDDIALQITRDEYYTSLQSLKIPLSCLLKQFQLKCKFFHQIHVKQNTKRP